MMASHFLDERCVYLASIFLLYSTMAKRFGHTAHSILLLLLSIIFPRRCQCFMSIKSSRSFFITGKSLTFASRELIIVRRGFRAAKKRTAMSMKIRVGICGLANVGKSTLFNALAQKSVAQAANFPFCTIEPNLAPIAVPDEYLQDLGKLARSKRFVPATMQWVDVAGLIKNAHRGEGLGNRFLASLRECDAICHLIRTFEDKDIVHVDGKVNPTADAEVVNLELLLADLAHAERRLEKTTCKGEERAALEVVVAGLKEGIPARALGLSEGAVFSIKSMGLLTLKPVLYTFNVDEVDFTLGRSDALSSAEKLLKTIQYCDPSKDMFTIVSAKIEAELSVRDTDEQLEYLTSLGMELEPGQSGDDLLSYNVLPSMIKRLLDLTLVYTGPGVPPERSRTTRAHLFAKQSLTAEGLAGRLHGDIQKGFIRAEVTPAPLLLQYPSYTAAKESGCIRTEGRECVLNADDVVLIKWK